VLKVGAGVGASLNTRELKTRDGASRVGALKKQGSWCFLGLVP
jgi:hypothetical protein